MSLAKDGVPGLEEPDPSHDLDMVPVFSESGAMAELEATAIQGVLDANDIPFTVSGNSTLPVTEFAVSVPESRLEDAQRAIAEAQAAGPTAAEQAELESESVRTPGESL